MALMTILLVSIGMAAIGGSVVFLAVMEALFQTPEKRCTPPARLPVQFNVELLRRSVHAESVAQSA